MMTRTGMFKALSFGFFLSGVTTLQGCKNNDFAYEVAKLTLTPNKQKRYVEDFPIWKFVGYGDGQLPIENPTSIEIDFPNGYIFQQGIEYGAINAAEENLPYLAVPDFTQLDANDIARSESAYWLVKGGDTVYKTPIENSNTNFYHHNQWQLENAEFTEIAKEANTNIVWLLDNSKNRLYRFDPDNDNLWPYYSLPDSLIITDLSLLGDTITLTYQSENDFYMTRFFISDSTAIEIPSPNQQTYLFENVDLVHDSSWHISGFEDRQVTDASYLPDGRLMISLAGATENLYLITDEEANIGDGPIPITDELTLLDQLSWHDEIRQPSGLSPRSDGTWFVVTDQAEVFIVTADFSEILHSGKLSFTDVDCNQGCTEGIATIDDDSFYVITDARVITKFSVASQGFTNQGQYPLTLDNTLTFAGMALDPLTGLVYLVNTSGDSSVTDALYTLDSQSQFSLISSVEINRFDVEDIWLYDAQGVYFNEDKVYVVSERYTQLIQLNLQGEIEHVYEFSHEDIAHPSDLSIKDGKIYITGDHEDDMPVPAVKVYQLP